MVTPFRFDRTWVFGVEPEQLFAIVSRTDEFTEWWPWLRRCDLVSVSPGERATCEIQAPLPYVLHLTIDVEAVEPAALIATRVSGDLRGPASLLVEAHPDGCACRLEWDLELSNPVLRNLAGAARPAMVWAHDRVVAAGVTQFEQRALAPARERGP
jgi:uncharacterized protein YndB with AHSA1/START domain